MTIDFRDTVTKYQNRTTGATIEIRANFAKAASPIEVRYDGGSWQTTQFQVADAKHDPRNALLLLLKLGRINMKRAKSPAEAIGYILSADTSEVREYRYQPTKYARIHVYAIGDTYYCATLTDQTPPAGWDWVLIDSSPYHSRKVYKAQA